MRSSGHAWAGLWYGAVWLLGLSVLVLVWSWRLFTPAEFPDRSLKFLRVAYIWLLISLDMLVLMPAYQCLLTLVSPGSPAADLGFSHAYYGAVRHAITVGFISLMIVGVAAKVVPTLNGVDIHKLTGLWGPFILINAGCSLRVGGQIVTDITAIAFPVTAISGLLEVAGLAWWGSHLWLVMNGRYSHGLADSESTLKLDQPIEARHRVGEILDTHPQLLNVFVSFGFTPLQNPLARKLFARHVSVSQACHLLGVDQTKLLVSLNQAIAPRPNPRVALPVLADSCSPVAESRSQVANRLTSLN
jgi:hypothetical protein